MARVKICGLTSAQDALECAKIGADAIGVIVEVPVDTPRKVSSTEARKILEVLPDNIERFMVIMPQSLDEAVDLYEAIKPDVMQLHGKESVSFVKELKSKLPCKVTKTIHVRDQSSVEEAIEYSRYCDYILLDTPSKIGGGSGRTHDWSISRQIVESVKVPVIMSGGLNPSNVEEAIQNVKPAYVDTASGVESQPGLKDLDKVREFIEKAKSS